MRPRLVATVVVTCGLVGVGTAVASQPEPVERGGPALSMTTSIMQGMTAKQSMTSAASRPADDRQGAALLKRIRKATDRFHNIATAESAGYVQLKDVNRISCITEPGMGAMGVHYVNPELITNPAIDATMPEALVFAPDRDGTLRLAALEYLVDAKTWNAANAVTKHGTNRPVLFRGHPFNVTSAPNRYGLATFYSQHVWAWKANPAGRLSMWNPAVHCSWA